MVNPNYKAVFALDRKNNLYMVEFPDFPGLRVVEQGYDEAIEATKKTLSEHIREELKSFRALPKPKESKEIDEKDSHFTMMIEIDLKIVILE